ncbi:Alpha-1,3-glucosyltransferase [Aphelenchoides bicaudatus]|nr:Alpha-1,3-glucosyltransferase [Aphelenchoides bicaudatus]
MKTAKSKSQFAFSFDVFLVCFGLSALKCALIFCYTSTDFEVHRNWKSLTRHLPLEKWYFDETSEWTLDYPPFFAYFEWLLGFVAEKVDPQIVTLQSNPLMTTNIFLFQRFSVIICDVVFYVGCIVLAENAIEALNGLSNRLKDRLKLCLFCFLAMNPSLILLDNIHFQYNSMMYGIFFCAAGLILRGNHLTGALLFSVLLNFKHIYLYYVPAFVGFYLTHYLLPFNFKILARTVQLGIAVALPVIISFGPFIAKGGIDWFQQILTRLFPFKRGLTHSYWAPNFWSLYNFADYTLNRVFKLLRKNVESPKYTSGIVQVYEHTVLANITPLTTHILVLVSLSPLIALFFTRRSEKFLLASILSSFSFFLFSWHAHEKAIILVFVPFTVLAFKELKFIPTYLLLSMCTVVAQMPLIYEVPVENLIKYSLAIFYLAMQFAAFKLLFALPFKTMMPKTNRVFLIIFVALELYKQIVHSVLFKDKADFLPLMATSVLCAIGIHLVFVQLLYEIFGQSVKLSIARRLCLQRESKIKATFDQTSEAKEPKLVAGLDISTYHRLDESLAVASYTLCSFPDMKIVYAKDQIVLLDYEYFPDFLSVRELDSFFNLLGGFTEKFAVDLLLIDGNGRFHKRGMLLRCGLACQIGYLANIPSVGVAKNFGGSGLQFLGIEDARTADKVEQMIKDECKQCTLDTAFELFYEGKQFLTVYRSATSTTPVYLSPGFNVNWTDLLELTQSTMFGSACQPIRLSDLRSRACAKKLFDEGCQRFE